MKKKLLIIKDKKELDLNVDGFIIGVDKLSINLPIYFSLDETIEIIEYCNKNNKEIFISLNKNMHNKDLDYLKEILIKLNDYNIKGVLFYDISIVNLKDKLGLKYDLVWNQEHLTTNYFTCNFWNEKGVNYAYLSSEITIEEVNEIRKNTNMILMYNVFGYLPMFASRRHLVKNYLDNFNLEGKDNYFIRLKDKKYKIIDNENGTIAYSNYVLNIIDDIDSIDVDYVVYNSLMIDDIEDVLTGNIKYEKEVGFAYAETIYKVKK